MSFYSFNLRVGIPTTLSVGGISDSGLTTEDGVFITTEGGNNIGTEDS